MSEIELKRLKSFPFRVTQQLPVFEGPGVTVVKRRRYKLTYANILEYYILLETRKVPGLEKEVIVMSMYNLEGQYIEYATDRWKFLERLVCNRLKQYFSQYLEITVTITVIRGQ